MHVGSGDNTYKWGGNWASVPDTESARTGFAHHGVVFTETGDVMTFHQTDSTLHLCTALAVVLRPASRLVAGSSCTYSYFYFPIRALVCQRLV